MGFPLDFPQVNYNFLLFLFLVYTKQTITKSLLCKKHCHCYLSLVPPKLCHSAAFHCIGINVFIYTMYTQMSLLYFEFKAQAKGKKWEYVNVNEYFIFNCVISSITQCLCLQLYSQLPLGQEIIKSQKRWKGYSICLGSLHWHLTRKLCKDCSRRVRAIFFVMNKIDKYKTQTTCDQRC